MKSPHGRSSHDHKAECDISPPVGRISTTTTESKQGCENGMRRTERRQNVKSFDRRQGGSTFQKFAFRNLLYGPMHHPVCFPLPSQSYSANANKVDSSITCQLPHTPVQQTWLMDYRAIGRTILCGHALGLRKPRGRRTTNHDINVETVQCLV